MPLFEEKRRRTDRRVRNDGPPPGCRERRIKRDRRQTEMHEISFHEWTKYLIRFKERAARKAAARKAAEAAEAARIAALEAAEAANGQPPEAPGARRGPPSNPS
jgi:hypothetical protein